ncbi:hypothetical protein Q5P01_000898 [Channa striata]|uniref:Uncharacterized protein n=1 Tax=Channa striata TaxID=64152 RepID=A0AA88IH06_CHASR|nr:hypothetical protein Q5P01_000898 [Channa striata]
MKPRLWTPSHRVLISSEKGSPALRRTTPAWPEPHRQASPPPAASPKLPGTGRQRFRPGWVPEDQCYDIASHPASAPGPARTGPIIWTQSLGVGHPVLHGGQSSDGTDGVDQETQNHVVMSKDDDLCLPVLKVSVD